MSLNLNALRLFDAVARTGNVTRAAEQTRVSQPAISKAMQELERGLGVVLLERRARGVRLTEAGAVLAESARTLFGLARTAEEDMHAFRGLQRGTLRLGASTTIGAYYLPAAMAEFARRHPDIELRLTIANTREIARRLAAYDLDVALVEGPVKDARLAAVEWRQDELVLLAARDHALGNGTVEWSAVQREVLLVREPGSGTRDVIEGALRAAGLAPGRTIELGTTEAILRGVASGLGLGFVSRIASEDQLALGRVAVVTVPGLRVARTFTRLTVRGRRLGAAALAFEALLA